MNFDILVYDPATPFKKVLVSDPDLSSWHEGVVITNELLEKLPHVESKRKGELQIPGGISIDVPIVEIGIKIGRIELTEIEALVVDSGYHQIILGSETLKRIFQRKDNSSTGSQEEEVHSSHTENPDELSIQLYPTKSPYPSIHLETILKEQRVLHNIALLALNEISCDSQEYSLDEILNNDKGIPEHLQLEISTIEEGSIWISLKSGSNKALKYVGSFYERGASAKLSQEMAEAKKASVDANIAKDTRDAVAQQIISEKEKFRAENIQKTYEVFRKECKAQLRFWDELIKQTSSPEIKKVLIQKKDEAILSLADQQMVPIVRHSPGAFVQIENDIPSLPAPDKS